MMYRRVGLLLVLVALLIAFCISSVYPPSEEIKLGLDLKGGTLLQYRLDFAGIPASQHRSVAEEVKKIVYKRLDRFGLKEIQVRRVGRNRIQVAIPGVSREEVEQLKSQVRTAGKLSWHLVVDEYKNGAPKDEVEKIQKEWSDYRRKMEEWNRKFEEGGRKAAGEKPEEPDRIASVEYAQDEDTGERKVNKKTNEYIVERWWILHNEPENKISGRYIKNASPTTDRNMMPAVNFTMTPTGAAMLSELTGKHKGDLMAVVVDDVVISAPKIKAQIGTSGIITGNFKSAEARHFANILSVGSLPTRPILTQEETIGAGLGKDSIRKGRQAVVIAFLCVVAFMAVYYLVAGLIADIALFFNLLLILSYVATFDQALTLPGIAGVLLTVGMAVDANILVFERIREELKKGKGLNPAVGAGYKSAFWTIFDANATTFITGFVLFKVGSGPIQGFAITLMAGLVANFVTSLYVSRLFMSTLYKLGLLKKLPMLEAFSTPNIRFMTKRRGFAALSAVLLVAGTSFVIYRGKDSVGIDFRGGMEMNVSFDKPLSIREFKKMLSEIKSGGEKLFAKAEVQALQTTQKGAHGFVVRIPSAEALKKEGEDKAIAEAAAGSETPGGQSEGKKPSEQKSPDSSAGGAEAEEGEEKKAGPGSRFRKALQEKFSEYLAPPPFPKATDKPYEVNPDKRIVTLHVNVFTGESPYVIEYCTDLQQLLGEYLKKERARREETPGRKQLGEFHIADVEIVDEKPDSPYTTFGITTTPVRYGAEGAPSGKSVVLSAIRSFFGSDFYGKQLTLPHLRKYSQFNVSEPLPSVSYVDSAVAVDFQGSAMLAILISLLTIIFYVALRFEYVFGLGAVAALVHDILFGLGAVAVADYLFGSFFSVKINLSTIAAFLTIIGYSLNDTIVVFDRIRENLKKFKKRTIEEVVNTSVNQVLSRTVLTSTTTFFVLLILLLGGGESVQGFAFVMLVGVVVGTYSSIFVASPSMIYFRHRRERKHERRVQEASAKSPSKSKSKSKKKK